MGKRILAWALIVLGTLTAPQGILIAVGFTPPNHLRPGLAVVSVMLIVMSALKIMGRVSRVGDIVSGAGLLAGFVGIAMVGHAPSHHMSSAVMATSVLLMLLSAESIRMQIKKS